MVKDFGLSKEEDIGYSVGFIASAFSFAQLLTSMMWGWLSDRYGRRPILLFGLIGNSVSILMFGLSKSLTWAIVSRFACGFLNGNIGVAKTVLGEITDKSNQAKAFSLIGLNFGIGMVIGPSLGGVLANPTKTMPYLFGNIQFLETYPYFLPCLCSAMITLVGFCVGYLFLPETCKRKLAESSYTPIIGLNDTEVNLLDDQSTDEHEPINTEQAATQSLATIGYKPISCAVAYLLLAFQSIVFMETFPLWAVAKPGIGLGFNIQNIGICLSSIGVFTLLSQLFIYPWLATKMSPLSIFRYPTIGLLGVFLTLPMISAFIAPNPSLSYLLWPLLITIMGINNSAAEGQLGIVNGMAQGAASFARAIGPALGGTVWAWSIQNNLPFPFNHVFIFTFVGIFTAILLIHAFTVLSEDEDTDNL
ncbi:hypothetical protein HDV02_001038 [Globomyces sp. JEL0801]|nr:hypothetical protein HDV02_001038 [Globomyces sp. JEL0801]